MSWKHGGGTGGVALPALGHALAGSISTALSHLLTYPLDLVVTRLQVRQRGRPQGVGGGGEEERTGDADDDDPGSRSKADVMNRETRDDDVAGFRSVLDAVRDVYRGGRDGSGDGRGWKAFYSGVEYDVFKSMADAFLFFLAYTFLRGRMSRRVLVGDGARKGRRSLSVPEELVVGMLAGAFGKAFTTPVQVIITRKQMMGLNARKMNRKAGTVSSEKSGTLGEEEEGVAGSDRRGDGRGHRDEQDASSARAIARQIYRRKGLRGFWAGYTATLILTLNPSLTFLLHRVFSRLLLSRSRRVQAHPGSLVTFFLAALSKAVASTVTYPFSLAKARLQAADGDADEGSKSGSGSENEKKSAVKGVFQDTIFHSVVRIVRRDGASALYAGLEAEVLKGFLSHGNTMAIKERVHVIVVWLYLSTFRALKDGIGGDEFLDDSFQKVKMSDFNKAR